MSQQNAELVLRVRNLRVSFRTDEGLITAVDCVNFDVARGKTLGIVGESGSGKSVSTKAIVRLLPPTAIIGTDSSIELHTKDGRWVETTRMKPNGREIREIRGEEVAMIFQEPMASFSPVHTVGEHITEAIRAHSTKTQKEAKEIAIEMLDRVGIASPAKRFSEYPFELSGGMRQRAMIAVALSTNPNLLVADEPTTALDVTIQAQILDLMREIRDEFNMGIVFITHDLGVISKIADEVSVMYLGRIMEHGPTREIIKNPQHPYTQALLEAIPRLDTLGGQLSAIKGDIPSPLARPTGCPFHTRCRQFMAGRCDVSEPALTEVKPGHTVSCFLYEEG